MKALTQRFHRKAICSIALSLLLFQSLGALAAPLPNTLPTGYQVQAGSVGFNTSTANTLNVNSGSAKAIVNYDSFSIGSNATVNFNLPSSGSAILNRVVGDSLSEIFGKLNSNGNVFLINPNGILFGAGSQVNVGALIASTLNISNSNFLNGNYIFNRLDGKAPGSIVNNGTIDSNNFLAFLSGGFINTGEINSRTVGFGVGDKISLSFGGNVGMELTVNEPLKEKVAGFNTAISNSGNISGKFVEFESFINDKLYDSIVNNSGNIIAKDLVNANGSFRLISKSFDPLSLTSSISGDSFNSGSILADSVLAYVGELENSGSIENKGLFDFYGNLFNKGTSSSIKTGSFKSLGDWLWNQGLIESLGNVSITTLGTKTELLTSSDGRHIYSGPNGLIFVYSAPSYNFYGNPGYLQIMQGVTTPGQENTSFSILNDKGTISSGGRIDLDGKDILNKGGLIEAAGDINIKASNSFSNESLLGFDFSNSPDPGIWGTPRSGSAEYQNFYFSSIWTAPGNIERSDNAGVQYYQGYWESTPAPPLIPLPLLSTATTPISPFQRTVLLFGSETWTDTISDLGIISSGKDLTIKAPEISNKAGLMEASNNIAITGTNFFNQQAVLNQTTHFANTTSTQIPILGNGQTSGNINIVDAWSHNTPSSASSTIEAGNNLDIKLSGNANTSGDLIAGNNLFIQSQNLNVGLPSNTLTPPSKNLPGQLNLSGLSDSELSRSLRSELFRTVGRSHYTNQWKSANDSIEELKQNTQKLISEHPDWFWGKPLSPEQIAELEEPILWYVLNEDGSGQYIVYFPLDYEGISTDSTGTITAENLTLDIQNRLQNRGKIKAYEDLYIEAGSIFNERPVVNVYQTISGDKKYGNSGFLTIQEGGEISGKNTTLIADGNIRNRGGLIEGENDLTIKAGGNVINEAQVSEGLLTWDSKKSSTFYSKPKEYNSGTLSSGGELDINAGGKISNLASDIIAKDDINLTAKKGIENKWLASEHLTLSRKTTKKSALKKTTTYEEEYGHSYKGSTIYSENGDVNIKVGETIENPDGTSKFVAGGSFINTASDIITPKGSIKIEAGDVRISDGNIQSTNIFKQNTSGFSFSGGMPSFGSSKTKTQYSVTSQRGSNLVAGEDIDIDSEKNIKVSGSNMIAGGDINLTADNQIDIEKGKFTDTLNSKSSGVSVSIGAGTISFNGFWGSAKGSYDNLTPSFLLADNINLNAGASVGINASILNANNDIAIKAPKLDIIGDYERNNYESKTQSMGVTIALPGPSMGAGLVAMVATQIVNNLIPGGVGGGSGSISASYSQSRSHENSGQYIESELTAKKITFNNTSILSSGANIDGAIINGQEVNPNNHQDYSDSGSSSFGIGLGTNGISGSIGSGNYSIGAGIGRTNFVSFGFDDFSLGIGFTPGSNPETGASANTFNFFGSAYDVGINLGITDIANHDNLVSVGANYGMFSGGTSFQGGEIRDVSGTVGLWSGSSNINPVDWTCFVAGTPITMADGSTKAIETLKKGDKVLSWNERTGKNEARTVLNAFRKETKQIVELKLSNDKLIETTPDHPFYVSNKGWVEAGKLNLDDKLFDENHSEVLIKSIEIVDRSVPVYNLEIEGNHTYFAHGILVHNVNCWVTTKDKQTLLVTDQEYAQLIRDGKDPEFVRTESGTPTANNPNNPINQAFQAAQNGETVDFNYTPEQFVEFVQSEDGFKAQQNNQNMKKIISDHFKWIIVGSAAGIVFSRSVAAFKQAISGGSTNTRFVTNSAGETVDLKPTLDRISAGTKFPHIRDGSIFENRIVNGKSSPELPVKYFGYYREYVVPTQGVKGAGQQRIVTGSRGEVYYSGNHYKTFIRVK